MLLCSYLVSVILTRHGHMAVVSPAGTKPRLTLEYSAHLGLIHAIGGFYYKNQGKTDTALDAVVRKQNSQSNDQDSHDVQAQCSSHSRVPCPLSPVPLVQELRARAIDSLRDAGVILDDPKAPKVVCGPLKVRTCQS